MFPQSKVESSRWRVQGSGSRATGEGFRVKGLLGFRV